MSPVDPLATLRRRALRHALEDGAGDLVVGVSLTDSGRDALRTYRGQLMDALSQLPD